MTTPSDVQAAIDQDEEEYFAAQAEESRIWAGIGRLLKEHSIETDTLLNHPDGAVAIFEAINRRFNAPHDDERCHLGDPIETLEHFDSESAHTILILATRIAHAEIELQQHVEGC